MGTVFELKRAASVAAVLLPLAALLLSATAARAQGWAADLYAGRALYEPVSANVTTSSLAGGLRYGSPRAAWFYVTAAAPLDDQAPAWGALGGSTRLPVRLSGNTLLAGLDFGGHGYAYRDPVLAVTGAGGVLEAGTFLAAVVPAGRLELSFGGREHLAVLEGAQTSRGAVEAGVRLETAGPLRAGASVRWVRVAEGSFPAVGADLATSLGPVVFGVSAERWVASNLQDLGWTASASVPLGFVDAWAALRHDARDPLYWTAARQSWSLGLTRRFGARPVVLAVPVPHVRDGRATIRLPRAATAGAVSVAGDFTDWQPQPMRQAGSFWEFAVPLSPGVYRYSFVDANGRWFVPEDVPGRRDDGMGGHVAVLVVP
jgi:hypothetical protein